MNIVPMLAEAAGEAVKAGLTGNIHIGLAALGSAIGVGMIGFRAAEAVGRNPGASQQILIQALLSTAFAEGIVFFAIFLAKGQ
jgi:F-type H+-transporting ATPase subunit c